MSRFTGSLWKKSRRLGISLTGTGKELSKRPYAPGQHGANQRRKISEYGLQQQEKQKLRFMYGLNERQYRNLFDEAGKMKGIHGERSEEHTSELQSRGHLVCRLLLEKKKTRH